MLFFGRIRTLRSRADCNKKQFLVASGKESAYWSAVAYNFYWILPLLLTISVIYLLQWIR